MTSKLLSVLSLLLVFSLDGLVAAELANNNAGPSALSPDGFSVSEPQRRRRRVRRKQRGKATRSYGIKVMPAEGAPPPLPPPPPPTSAEPMSGAPPAEEMPPTAAPPPPPSDPMDAPGRGRAPAKKGAPRIKPPTVNIKPPTE